MSSVSFSYLLYAINFLNGSVLQSLKSGPLINKTFLSVVWVEFPVLRTLDKTASARSFKSSSTLNIRLLTRVAVLNVFRVTLEIS